MPHRVRHAINHNPFWVYLLLIVFLAIGAHFYSKRVADDAAQRSQELVGQQLAQGCGRSQLQRGYLLLRSRELKSPTADIAKSVFRIVWCEATFRVGYTGPTVFLPADAQECFLTLERRGYWNGRDVFTEPWRLRRECSSQ